MQFASWILKNSIELKDKIKEKCKGNLLSMPWKKKTKNKTKGDERNKRKQVFKQRNTLRRLHTFAYLSNTIK